LKNYEKESIFKNFLVFFSLLELLLVLLFFEIYHIKKVDYTSSILKDMRICSLSLKCKQFKFDFSSQDKDIILGKLYQDTKIHAYFSIPKSKKYYLNISYPLKKVDIDRYEIRKILWIEFFLFSILLFILALFFTFYSLNPIRKALKINDEFIKDILHDFNTPISAIILNIEMFEEDNGKNPYMARILKSIDRILLLQNNLKDFLTNSPSQNVVCSISSIAKESLDNISNSYPNLEFVVKEDNEIIKFSNIEVIRRIIDNLITNACKYNKPKGRVELRISNDKIVVSDTGKGIKKPKKVFKRYYKEQDRGIGLGLHIVKKLCDELNIKISIESKVDIGTEVILHFKYLKKDISSKHL